MTEDKLLRVLTFVSRIREAPTQNHVLRLKLASVVSKAIDSFIQDEVQKAQSRPQKDPCHLSWAQIGDLLDLSRSAAYSRYGKKEHERKSG